MGLVEELKRRKVFKVGAAYLVVAWLAVQAASIGFPAFDAPPWALRVFILLALLGFPVTLVMAWVFDVTPEGMRLDPGVTGSKRVFASAALLVCLALGWYFYGQPSFRKGDATTPAKYPVAAVPAAAPKNSIAVMAFDDLSPAHDQEYFSDGMSEEILNALARVKGLKVIGRSSSFQYKGRNIGATQVGQALGVAHLLQGSVRRQGDLLRITAALVQTADGTQEWSQTYDGKLADVFHLQESCARDIAAQLKVALVGGDDLVAKASDSPQAYALFVEAQTLVNRRFGDNLPRAIALLKQATDIDPNFARAWSKQAIAYAVLSQYVGGDWATNWQLSDAAARRALALDPNDPEAYAAISYNDFSQRHYVAMVEPMQRALQLDPDNAAAAYWAANESSALGRTKATEAQVDAILAHDPANALVLFYKGAMRWRAGDAVGTREVIGKMGNELSPFSQFLLSWLSAASGDLQAGAKQHANADTGFGTKFTKAELESIYLGTFGNEAQRQAGLKIVASRPHDDWVPTLLLQLGEPARSFDLFEHGTSGLSDAYLNWLWQREDWSRQARQDPAFQGFAKRMGMVDYWKRYGWPDLCKPAPAQGPDAFTCQ